MTENSVFQAYEIARDMYAQAGVDTERALQQLAGIPISLHCWQGDDVGGFETPGAQLSGGGIQATGNYPGKARTIAELRADIEKALSMVPGKHRLNLHASYLDNGGEYVERDRIEPEHFQSWIDWAKQNGLGHGLQSDLFFPSESGRRFHPYPHGPGHPRILDRARHGLPRESARKWAASLGTAAVTNVWIPDGYKDIPADRTGPRERLIDSLDRIFLEPIDPDLHLDAVEAKLFGIGSRELHGRFRRVLPGLRRLSPETA